MRGSDDKWCADNPDDHTHNYYYHMGGAQVAVQWCMTCKHINWTELHEQIETHMQELRETVLNRESTIQTLQQEVTKLRAMETAEQYRTRIRRGAGERPSMAEERREERQAALVGRLVGHIIREVQAALRDEAV
jgi:hypothetical protein